MRCSPRACRLGVGRGADGLPLRMLLLGNRGDQDPHEDIVPVDKKENVDIVGGNIASLNIEYSSPVCEN
jgi:hypothetical protein